MKICHIITRLIVGGAQENTVLTCRGLVGKGHDVTLIAGPETGPEGSLWDVARSSAKGLTLVTLDTLRRNISPRNDLRCLATLARLLRAGRFDVVHTHSSKAGVIGRFAAARANVPTIVHSIHGMSFNRTQSPTTRWLYRTLERRAGRVTSAFVSVADAMTAQAVAAGLGAGERFTTIHSGMETERFRPDAGRRAAVRREWGVSDDDIVVGTIARLFDNKGYDEIIAAMPNMLANAGNLRFVWVGDGTRRDTYLERLRRMGLSDRVRLTGLVSPDDIPGIVSGFDIVLHASRWEGLPRALVQGLLMEVPGVSFDNDGAPEVIADGETGLLVPYGDTDGLAEAVLRLAGDAALRKRLAKEGRARCLERFDWRAMVDQIDSLYRRVHRG